MFPSRGVKLKVTERAKIKNWYCYAVLILLWWPRQLHYRTGCCLNIIIMATPAPLSRQTGYNCTTARCSPQSLTYFVLTWICVLIRFR